MKLQEAEKLIKSKRYSIDIDQTPAYIQIEVLKNKKKVLISKKVNILAVGITQNDEIIYLIEDQCKKFYKLKSEVRL